MMLIPIWQSYFLKQFLRALFLFLFCFYGLYVLIDYASHAHTFSHSHSTLIFWKEAAIYYGFIFASKAEILLPLALLIAFVHTVCTLNQRQELVAFMASGFPAQVLMRPFIFVAIFFVLLLYANEEWILPDGLSQIRKVESANKQKKSRLSPSFAAQHIILENGSLLIFQNYDSIKNRFFDVYWIESADSVYRMKYLSHSNASPIGYFVDHLTRQKGELLQQSAYSELSFPGIKFNRDLLQSTILDPDILALSELAKQAPFFFAHLNEKESKIQVAFYWKLLAPWLCLLAIIAPAPFCVRFSRRFPIFLIYAGSLFGLIAFYMFLDAAQVIAQRQVLAPFLAICIPFFLIFGYFGHQFAKLK